MKAKSRYIIPNFFTGLNFLLGVFAILIGATYHQYPVEISATYIGKTPLLLSCWMIVWCVLLDKLDGFTAKLMNASSGFGAQFDSLADLIAFGVAPGFLTYFFIKQNAPEWALNHRPLLFVSLAVYVLCTAMRLARYNAVDGDELGDYFQGLPSTFGGGMMALVLILYYQYGLMQSYAFFKFLLPLTLIILGLLMVSPFYLPKLVKRRKSWINFVQVPATAFGYIFGFGMVFPEYMFTLLIVYGTVGFIHSYMHRETLKLDPAK